MKHMCRGVCVHFIATLLRYRLTPDLNGGDEPIKF